MYTAIEIDKMSIEEIDSLAQMLTELQLKVWAGCGYDGASYIRITK
tara:strand:+ start:228 stop:365 length:138 start_codon:yes stop_codon:yes gene_type:complete